MSAQLNLQEAILDPELRHVNFFNGRLLSGEDLSAERDANHVHLRHLGQAMGAGVACGLEVSRALSSPPSDVQVEIKKGLAINRNGGVLRLTCDQTVSLVRQPDPAKKADCVFSDCAPFAAGSTLSVDGYYLLTIAPASQREGLAPISGLGNSPTACNSRYITEGVQFRMLPMRVTPPSDADHARNEVAYQCFGLTTRGLSDLATDAISGNSSDSYALDNLIPGQRLTERDVPLAVIEWKSGSGIGFIDLWSVRRRITRPSASKCWTAVVSDRRVAEAEAIFLQFQEQVREMCQALAKPDLTRLVEHFRYLPPCGIVPLTSNRFAKGFHEELFFDTVTHHPLVHIEGARIEALLRAASHYPPVDLDSHVMLWVYRVRENEQAVAKNTPAPAVQPYLVFSTGHMAYMGDPHFDVNRWDFSNWA